MRKIRTFWRLAAFCLVPLFIFAACGKDDDAQVESVTISPTPTVEPTPYDPYTVEPDSAQAVIEAYLFCLQDGELEKAQQYVWPMAEEQEGEATLNFWQPFSDSGYLTLESYKVVKTGESPYYTMYNVDLTFTLPAGQERSGEAVAAGDVIVKAPTPEELEAELKALDEDVVERAVPSEASAPDDEDLPLDEEDFLLYGEEPTEDESEGEGDAGEETDADSGEENGSEDADTASPTGQNGGDNEEDSEKPIASGYETVLLTVIHADGRYYVSPDNLLVAYQAEEPISRVALEHLWAQEEEDGLAEVEGREAKTVDAPELTGVYAKVVSARRYADSLSVDIRFENYDEEAYVMGEVDFPPILSMEGVFLGSDTYASPELAESMGLTPLSEGDGAKGGVFDTFASHATLEPGAPDVYTTMENVRFLGNYEVVYSLYFTDFGGELLAVDFDNLIALPGYLPVSNPFADFEFDTDTSDEFEGEIATATASDTLAEEGEDADDPTPDEEA